MGKKRKGRRKGKKTKGKGKRRQRREGQGKGSDDWTGKVAKLRRKEREVFLPTLGKKKFFLTPILPTHLPHPLSLHPSLFPSPSLPILFSFTSHFPSLFTFSPCLHFLSPSPSIPYPFFHLPSSLPFPF